MRWNELKRRWKQILEPSEGTWEAEGSRLAIQSGLALVWTIARRHCVNAANRRSEDPFSCEPERCRLYVKERPGKAPGGGLSAQCRKGQPLSWQSQYFFVSRSNRNCGGLGQTIPLQRSRVDGSRRVFDAGLNIPGLKIGVISQDFQGSILSSTPFAPCEERLRDVLSNSAFI